MRGTQRVWAGLGLVVMFALMAGASASAKAPKDPTIIARNILPVRPVRDARVRMPPPRR